MNIVNLAQLQYYKKLRDLGFKYVDKVPIYSEPILLSGDINLLKNSVINCNLCSLCESKINASFGYGSTSSDIMFIGDKFSMQEDILGEEFSSRSLSLLEKIIETTLHLTREDVYITNLLKCRPREDEVIKNEYIVECLLYLNQQISIINPKIIVALGELSFKHLTHFKFDFKESRGKIINMKKYKLIGVEHPITLLKNSSLKREAFNDFKIINRLKEDLI